MEEQQQIIFMHGVRLRKRERLADKAAQSLSERVVETLNMAGLPIAFARRTMLCFWQHFGVSLPEIREHHTPLVSLGHTLPHQAAGGFNSVADGIGHNLARSPALSKPHPSLVSSVMDERPHLVHLQHVFLLSLDQCLLERWPCRGFF